VAVLTNHHTQCLKATQIYYLIALEVRVLNSRGWWLSGGNCFLFSLYFHRLPEFSVYSPFFDLQSQQNIIFKLISSFAPLPLPLPLSLLSSPSLSPSPSPSPYLCPFASIITSLSLVLTPLVLSLGHLDNQSSSLLLKNLNHTCKIAFSVEDDTVTGTKGSRHV
jgi:hypothetical protein